ncbi:transporter substrate-binding domain-containing protein [Rhizobiaceae bacterium BDR2-2]|uniref:Transporter substrate-binding domain-containing protein n=1 Tax=Ectorhizobium quercum TaxID=2965071 RepID=A0AAE3SVU1_9HYPH|nr:transporter substrate-binding domain-containing protein [Ectorhizobium quercum]MCX8997329.1 transporter substrate-binding domain-containing protein [Ectorhizobium quercum]
MKIVKLLGAATAFGIAFAGAATADQLADIRKAGVIRVATDMGVPPYGMMSPSLQPVGSDVDTANLLAESLGVKLELVPVTGANRIPFLLTDKADVVISSFSMNAEREKVIDFSRPYGKIQIVIAGPASEKVKSFNDLAGKRVVVTRGTTADSGLTEGAPKAEIVRFDDDATLVTAVTSGQADLAANTPSVIKTINERRSNDPLEIKFLINVFPYAIGLRKGESELKDYLDGWVADNLANGKLNTIYKTWHGADLPDMND